jgi:hypothetical protein
MRGLEKDRSRRYQAMEVLESDLERLLAGDMGVAIDEAAVAGLGPDVQPRSRWPWHLAVTMVFAVGIGTAALLARGGNSDAASPKTPVSVQHPAGATPAAKQVAAVKVDPTISQAPSPAATPSLLEPVRRVGRFHPSHPTTTAAPSVAPSSPTPKKSKADDKVAPSPYTAPQAP